MTGRAADTPCRPELDEGDAGRMLVHCGPARARVTVGDETLVFEGGSCERGEGYLAVNIGRQSLEPRAGDERQRYFGLLAGDISGFVDQLGPDLRSNLTFTPLTGDGPFTGDVFVTWMVGDRPGALRSPTIRFSDDVSAASFTGRAMLTGTGEVRGEVDCGETAAPSRQPG